MFFENAFTNPLLFCSWILVVMISIVLHELAHGAMAIRLGDDTPRILGRMTLDPLVHMGFLSIALLVMFGIAFGSMPVDHRKLRGRFAGSWVAIAGPAANFALALIFACAFNLVGYFTSPNPSPIHLNLLQFLAIGLQANVLLGLFNLIPVPPLDGYAAVAYASRPFARATANEFFQRYSFLLLFVLLYTGFGNTFFRAVTQLSESIRSLMPFSA